MFIFIQWYYWAISLLVEALVKLKYIEKHLNDSNNKKKKGYSNY